MSWVITPQLKTLDGLVSNVVAWWDASDESSFTFSSGTVVQDWRSRIGNYTLTQSTSANRPSRSGTVNGKPTVVFDGTNDSLSVANFDMTPGGQKFSFWAVVSATSGGDQFVFEHSSNFNLNSGAFSCIRNNDNTIQIAKVSGAGILYSTFAPTATVTTTPKAFIGFHDGTLTTNESSGRLNGSTSGTRVINNNTSANNRNDTLYIGGRGGTTFFLNGQICELGITTSILNASEIASLESYLSSKWGLGF